MVIAFRIVLVFILIISFIGAFGEKEKSLQEKMLAMFFGH